MSLSWLYIPIGFIWIIGAYLTIRGLRNQRIDDHPWCARCKYDLFGLPAERTVCPECGADLTQPASTGAGHYRHKLEWIFVGFLLLALSYASFRCTTYLRREWAGRPVDFPTAVLTGNVKAFDQLIEKDPLLL